MSAGVIPVVLHRGGVTDIVKHEQTGFLAADGAAVEEMTEGVYALTDEARERLRRAATAWVERFSQNAFARNFRVLANRGVLSKPFRFVQQQTLGALPAQLKLLLPATAALLGWPGPSAAQGVRVPPGSHPPGLLRLASTLCRCARRLGALPLLHPAQARPQSRSHHRAAPALGCAAAPRPPAHPAAAACRRLARCSSSRPALLCPASRGAAFEYVVKNVMHHLGPDWAL
jgi:hypothetical protein